MIMLLERDATHLPLPLKIKHRKTTNIPNPLHVDRKLPKEIDDRRAGSREREAEDKGGEEDGEEFFEEDGQFEGEEFGEFRVDLYGSMSTM